MKSLLKIGTLMAVLVGVGSSLTLPAEAHDGWRDREIRHEIRVERRMECSPYANSYAGYNNAGYGFNNFAFRHPVLQNVLSNFGL